MAAPGRKPQPEPVRKLVFTLLTQVNREGAYANLRLPELLSQSNLEERERALATEMAYGTLRMQGKHDALIKRHIDRSFESLDAGIVDLLRLGIHQIREMRIPNHAAVAETVEVARATIGESKASYVNALLRKAISDEKFESDIASISDIKSQLSIKYSHPEWIVSSYFDALKNWSDVEELLASNNVAAKPQLIAWPGRSSVDELLLEGGEVLEGTSYGVISAKAPGSYKAIRERRAGVQDRGSQVVAEIFAKSAQAITEPLSWLDMCAGPGGKASALYTQITTERPQDSFLANEPMPHRAELVKQVIPADKVMVSRGQDLPNQGLTFDRIIIDAPCTGLGALRRRPEARWRRSTQDLKELVAIQRELISAGVSMLKEDGYLAYVTCSPHLFETRAHVVETLARNPQLELINLEPILNPGIRSSAVLSDGSLQLWTHLDNADSMFMALFHKKVK
jgi:16S rRNA (cytosine967-C5)-methyltransferase